MPESQIFGTAQGSRRALAPKLRSSCDSCGDAKVKCDRGRPGCRRCTSLGLVCVYGISRKSGKPPRRRPTERSSGTRRSPETTAPPPATGREHDVGNVSRAVAGTQSPHNQHTEHGHRFGSLIPVPRVAPMPIPDLDAGLGENRQGSEPGSVFFGMPMLALDEWPRMDDFEAEIGMPAFTSDLDMERQPPGHLDATGTDASGNKSHSCARESYEIFRDLICPGPSLHAPEADQDTVSTQLDHVLHFNSTAIDRLGRILGCPCSKSGHRVMVHASIFSRILIWYQQAAGWTGCASWGSRRPPSPADDRSSASSSPSDVRAGEMSSSSPVSTLAQSTGFAVEEVPLWFGTFSVEDQNMQALFRNQLVLSELKKMSGLIDMFSAQTTGESHSAIGLAGLYLHVGDWLRDEHSRTVKILKSRLNALNEALVS